MAGEARLNKKGREEEESRLVERARVAQESRLMEEIRAVEESRRGMGTWRQWLLRVAECGEGGWDGGAGVLSGDWRGLSPWRQVLGFGEVACSVWLNVGAEDKMAGLGFEV